MSLPGKIVEFTDKSGNINKGIVYNGDHLINGKTIVYLWNDKEEIIRDLEGRPFKTLVSTDKLKVIGYID